MVKSWDHDEKKKKKRQRSWTYLSKLSLGCGFQLIQLFPTKQFLWKSQQLRQEYKGKPWQNHRDIKDFSYRSSRDTDGLDWALRLS